jgi:regulator of sigma E protease
VIVSILQGVAAFILVLAPLIFIHELGHFLVAKALGIGCPVFSIGFGPRLVGFRRKETDYRLSLIPVGGYVRLAGDEADENRSGAPEEFLSRPRWQRLIVYLAGAAFNLILAFLATWLMFGVYGKDVIPDEFPVIYRVEAGSNAEQAGIESGDKIIEVSGLSMRAPNFLEVYGLEILLAPNQTKRVLVERAGRLIELDLDTGAADKFGRCDPGWAISIGGGPPAVVKRLEEGERAEAAGLMPGDRILGAEDREPISEIELRLLLLDSPERDLALKVGRDGDLLDITLRPRSRDGRGYIGVEFFPVEYPRVELSIGEAAVEAWRTDLVWSKTLYVFLKGLVTVKVSIKALSGPIGIAHIAWQALLHGPEDFLRLLAFFSLQLGILNLLPIPVLDGGHILILLVEGTLRRDLSEKVKERVMLAGFVFLIAFMGFIIVQDVMKII